MTNLSSELKKQLIAITTEHYHNYLALHQKLNALDAELPNDDYLVGMGLELEKDLPEERLEKQFYLAVNQLMDVLKPISSLSAIQKNKISDLAIKDMLDFCRNPNQQKIAEFNKQFHVAIDKLFPHETVARPVKTLSIFDTVNPIQLNVLDEKIETCAVRYA